MKLNRDEPVELKAPRSTTLAELIRSKHVCQHVESGACTRCMYPMRVHMGVRSFPHNNSNPNYRDIPSPSVLIQWKKLLDRGLPLCRFSS